MHNLCHAAILLSWMVDLLSFPLRLSQLGLVQRFQIWQEADFHLANGNARNWLLFRYYRRWSFDFPFCTCRLYGRLSLLSSDRVVLYTVWHFGYPSRNRRINCSKGKAGPAPRVAFNYMSRAVVHRCYGAMSPSLKRALVETPRRI